MPDAVLVLLGGLVVTAVFVDAFMTTFSVSAGAGPFTARMLNLYWRVLLKVHRQDKKSSFLTAAGTLVLSVTVLMWVFALWAGWSLLLAGSGAIVDATSGRPAGGWDIVYYAGFTVFTLGTGDFVADSASWRVVTAFASFSGLFLVTLAITYLISVVSAVVARRALAVQVTALGSSPGDIVARGWTGDQFGDMFQQHLVALTSTVALSAEQHLAYPVLHYFHTSDRSLSAPVALACLDDALTIMRDGVAPGHGPEPSAVSPLGHVLTRYLSTAGGTTAWAPDADAPPPPDLGAVVDAGVPLVEHAHTGEIFRRQSSRRESLHRIVLSDGWSWEGSAGRPSSLFG